eukprot:2410207-Rhodomonas_salina.1
MDEQEEWHDGVSWECKSKDIHPRTLCEFHQCSLEELSSIPVIPDWSKPSDRDRVEAGVPAKDIKRRNFRRRCAGDICGMFYRLPESLSEKQVTHVFQEQGTNAEEGILMGVVLGTSQYLGKGVGVELSLPAGDLFFVTSICVQCTDAQLDGGETELRGHSCVRVSALLANPFDRQTDYGDWLDWE